MVRFDDSIEAVLGPLEEHFRTRLPETTLVRDPAGRVTVVLPDDALPQGDWNPLAQRLHDSLGRWSPGTKQVLLRVSDLIDAQDILESPDRVRLDRHNVSMVDRLVTNLDWLRQPLAGMPPAPPALMVPVMNDGTAVPVPAEPLSIATFFGIKGGVGRTTAAAVLAWHLASQGKRVLVVDLDLEAPGLGEILLPELPDYGLVDWFVEDLGGQADRELFEQMQAPAPLASGLPGWIRVIPAAGSRTGDYIAKLGRAYLPALDEQGAQRGVPEHLASLLQRAATRIEPPEVVLLDSRAGLHDIGAAAVTRLGAEVFLFGRDDPQSWSAYDCLFRHLSRSTAIRWGMPEDDLRWRLKMVAAQVEPNQAASEAFLDRSYSAWTALYDEEDEVRPGAHVFERDDPQAPHHALAIAFDPRLRSIDLVDPARRPEAAFIRSVFGSFVDGAAARLLPSTTAVPSETSP